MKPDCTAGFKETVVPSGCVNGSKSKHQPAVSDVCWRLNTNTVLKSSLGNGMELHPQQVPGMDQFTCYTGRQSCHSERCYQGGELTKKQVSKSVTLSLERNSQ